jgi:hypothetical protein
MKKLMLVAMLAIGVPGICQAQSRYDSGNDYERGYEEGRHHQQMMDDVQNMPPVYRTPDGRPTYKPPSQIYQLPDGRTRIQLPDGRILIIAPKD